MTEPKLPPATDRYCEYCGGDLDIRLNERQSGAGQGSVDTTCTKCGRTGGFSWATFSSRRPSSSLFSRLKWAVGLNRPRVPRPPAFRTAPGQVDVRGLVEAADFPVYGLKDRPQGLRMNSIGWGSSSENINRVSLSYVRGHPRNPDAAFSIEELAEPPYSPQMTEEQFKAARAEDELEVIGSALRNHSSLEETERWSHEGSFNRDWNIERVRSTEHRSIEAEIAGAVRTLTTASWDGPHRVTVFSFSLPPTFVIACSWNFSSEDTVDALGHLVVLSGDSAAIAEHQEDLQMTHDLLWPEQ